MGLAEGSEAAVRAALRFSDDPDALVASVVDGMTRGELELALVTQTGCTRGELEAVRDLHRYAKSYASIAMSGIRTAAHRLRLQQLEALRGLRARLRLGG